MRAFGACLRLLFVAVLVVGAASASGAQKRKPQNPGGFWLLLAVRDDGSIGTKSVERTKAVIERRCRRLGVYCRIQRRLSDQPNRLMLRFSTRMGSGRMKEILLAEGVEVRAVVSPPFPAPLLEYASRAEAEAAKGAEKEMFPFVDMGNKTYLIVERAMILNGNDLRSCVALASTEDFGTYEVDCRLKAAGSSRLRTWTTANINRYLAVVFNGRVFSAGYVKAPIWYDFVVSGGLDQKQAQDMAVIFESGNLPTSVELLEEGTYRH